MDWPLTLRPLPRPVAPFRDETISSYLHRLAGPNHIDPAGLRRLLAGSNRTDAPVPPGRLAAVTAMPWRSLAYALPQICTPAELTGLHVQNRPRARDGGPSPPAGPARPASRSPGGRCTTRSSAPNTAAGSAKATPSPTSPPSRKSCTRTAGTGG